MTTRTAAPKGTTTDLHRAALVGDLAALRKCLAAGHAIDPRDADGHTPFLLACKQSEPEIFDILRLAGADLEAANSRGMSGLFLVASTGVVSLARVLIRRGAEVNRPAARGLTPLIAAIMSENPHMVRLLIDSGANVRHTDAAGTSVLRWARKIGTKEIVELIRKPDCPATVDDKERTAADLHRGARTGDVALIRECLAAKAPVDVADDAGLTPLMIAARQSKRAAIQALLEAGADPYRASRSGFNSLLLAANSPIALRPFVAARIDLDRASGRRRTTPLIHAARQGFGDVVQYLLDSGADPAVVDAEGLTAHDHAAANGHHRIARMLTEAAGSVRHAVDFRTVLPA
jgi:ankyrin repeat protein